MPFVSYARNCEDVILWRALHDVEKGSYVDVGAGDPEVASVTRAFYERGWSGINVQPLDEYFQRLVELRERDTNLKVALGRQPGLSTLEASPRKSLRTQALEIGCGPNAADHLVSETVLPTLTLTQVIEESSLSTIHFLKIDV
jgi:FkbM family methyltransferase